VVLFRHLYLQHLTLSHQMLHLLLQPHIHLQQLTERISVVLPASLLRNQLINKLSATLQRFLESFNLLLKSLRLYLIGRSEIFHILLHECISFLSFILAFLIRVVLYSANLLLELRNHLLSQLIDLLIVVLLELADENVLPIIPFLAFLLKFLCQLPHQFIMVHLLPAQLFRFLSLQLNYLLLHLPLRLLYR
jgi:hypothetical protein